VGIIQTLVLVNSEW